MDPAEAQRALSGQENLLGQYEQVLQILSHNVAAFLQLLLELRQHISHASFFLRLHLGPLQLRLCQGIPMHARAVLMGTSTSAAAYNAVLSFPSDAAKINYIIGLLQRSAPVWAQASSLSEQLSTLTLDELVKCFKRIVNRPNHAGCASDWLFTICQGA